MKPLVTLVLICMLLSEAFQVSEALRCHHCMESTCFTLDCSSGEDYCFSGSSSAFGQTIKIKGCATNSMCFSPQPAMKMNCCKGNLCNSAEGVKLSLLIMLVPLISSTLFI
ncbi:hypothetical protein AOLI_G00154870 [Acnodon oligacanthus]